MRLIRQGDSTARRPLVGLRSALSLAATARRCPTARKARRPAGAAGLSGLDPAGPHGLGAEIAGPEAHVAGTDRQQYEHHAQRRYIGLGDSSRSTMPRPVGIPPEIRCAAKVTINVAVKST